MPLRQTQGNPSLPDPLLAGTQWHKGEPINDVKLHQRIDLPLNQLGDVARVHGSNWVSFRATKTGATTGSATVGAAYIPWTTIVEDTHNGWQPLDNTFHVPVTGRYLISASFAQSTVIAYQMWLDGGHSSDQQWPMKTPVCEAIAGGGCQMSAIMDLFTFFDIGVQISATATALSADSCWLAVQQIGWLT